jgi:hypothetical protein
MERRYVIVRRHRPSRQANGVNSFDSQSWDWVATKNKIRKGRKKIRIG